MTNKILKDNIHSKLQILDNEIRDSVEKNNLIHITNKFGSLWTVAERLDTALYNEIHYFT